MSDIILSTDKLNVYYGQKQAIFDVSLAFERNQITALIGASGCGKSTFLRALNLMNREVAICRTEGPIYYQGRDINTAQENIYELRKNIGMVFQRPNPFHKSIYENVAFPLRRHGLTDKRKLDEVVETSLRQASLWNEVKDELKKSALALSGGQQQRLCIARTLAMQPDILLLDEPTSALDPLSTGAFEDLTLQLKEHYTLIIVTHNMQQAARISQNTAFFHLGEMVEYGATSSLFRNPKQQKTEEYVSGRFG